MDDTCFVIAEAGVNHNGSLELAKKLVDSAVMARADAIKFQSFSANRLVKEKTELVPYQVGSASDHFDLLQNLELSENEQRILAEYSKSKGITFLSTPYSKHDAAFLINLGVETIKVASADIVDLELHSFLCESQVKVIASTGMANQMEVVRLVEHYKERNNLHNLWLMQCVSNYPSKVTSQNLKVLEFYGELVGDRLGFSDHTESSTAALVAIGLGARVFEKHLTLSRSMNGPDHSASLEPIQFAEYVSNLKEAYESLGEKVKFPQSEEMDMRRISRKGVYLNRDISSGEVISRNDIHLIRPAQDTDAWLVLKRLPIISKSNYLAGDILRLDDED